MLDDFVKETEYSAEEIFYACERIKQYDEQLLTCLDYILACTEYEEFLILANEFKNINSYTLDNTKEDYLDKIINTKFN